MRPRYRCWQARDRSRLKNLRIEPKRGAGIADNYGGHQLVASPASVARPIVNVARFLERRSETAQLWRWSLKLRRQLRPLRPAAGSALSADGGVRRERWSPIGVIIRGSAADADQHFKGAIASEPNVDRVWAALMTGTQPGRTPFTVLQLATSGLNGGPRVRGLILRTVDTEHKAPSRSSPTFVRRKSKRYAISHGFR